MTTSTTTRLRIFCMDVFLLKECFAKLDRYFPAPATDTSRTGLSGVGRQVKENECCF
jgi:hypothetical protein